MLNLIIHEGRLLLLHHFIRKLILYSATVLLFYCCIQLQSLVQQNRIKIVLKYAINANPDRNHHVLYRVLSHTLRHNKHTLTPKHFSVLGHISLGSRLVAEI